MNPRQNLPWLPVERIRMMIQLEPLIVLVGIALGAWVVYKMFLKNLNSTRHGNLSKLFKNLTANTVMLLVSFGLYWALEELAAPPTSLVTRVDGYVGLFTIFLGATVLIKSSRIILFEWLFFQSMKAGVPVLLVNIFTLGMSVLLAVVISKELFNIDFAPVLATSAVFSIVLGLALQDTLGNLFAGMALQIDKPYQIGDWIEVQATNIRWAGQVQEITWRATVLNGWADELITIPNRIVSQAQVSNFSLKNKPIFRSQIFRFPYGSDTSKIRAALMRAGRKAERVRRDLDPVVIAFETHESWIPFKLVYSIDDYGQQFFAADSVIQSVVDELKKEKIDVAYTRVDLRDSQPT